MWSAQHSSTNSKSFFSTPFIKSKFSQSQEQCWRQCGNMNADHFFGSCPKIQTFWGNVCMTVGKILGYTIPNSVMVLYFCVFNENVIIKKDWYLCKILLMACKKAITKCWYKTEPPSLN